MYRHLFQDIHVFSWLWFHMVLHGALDPLVSSIFQLFFKDLCFLSSWKMISFSWKWNEAFKALRMDMWIKSFLTVATPLTLTNKHLQKLHFVSINTGLHNVICFFPFKSNTLSPFKPLTRSDTTLNLQSDCRTNLHVWLTRALNQAGSIIENVYTQITALLHKYHAMDYTSEKTKGARIKQKQTLFMVRVLNYCHVRWFPLARCWNNTAVFFCLRLPIATILMHLYQILILSKVLPCLLLSLL